MVDAIKAEDADHGLGSVDWRQNSIAHVVSSAVLAGTDPNRLQPPVAGDAVPHTLRTVRTVFDRAERSVSRLLITDVMPRFLASRAFRHHLRRFSGERPRSASSSSSNNAASDPRQRLLLASPTSVELLVLGPHRQRILSDSV